MTDRLATLLEILQDHFNPREEGWMWHGTSIVDDPRGVVNQIEGCYDDPIETARSLAFIINGLDGIRSYLLLCRNEGRPAESDQVLWRELRRLADAAPRL